MAFLVDLFFFSALFFLIHYLLYEFCYVSPSKDDHRNKNKSHACEKEERTGKSTVFSSSVKEVVEERSNSDGDCSVCEESSNCIKKMGAFESGDVCALEESTWSVLESKDSSSSSVEKVIEERSDSNGDGTVFEESSNYLEKLEALDTGKGGFDIGGDDVGKEESFVEEGMGEEWQGIERSEMERVFGKAVAFVGSKDNADKVCGLGSKERLTLYGLHKIAIEGPCVKTQPMAFKVSARAKWNAWKQLGDMRQEDAMEKYIILLSECCPEWIEDHNMEDGKQASAHTEESSKLPSNFNASPAGQLGAVDERVTDGEDSPSNWVEPKAYISAPNCLQ